MLIAIVGEKGSGKSLTAVKFIVDKKIFAFTNFKLIGIKNFQRLKFTDIISIKKYETKRGREITEKSLNWDFWNKAVKEHKNFCVFLDEIHNIIHARRFMEKNNILLSKWVSQIRKILADSDDNHLYIITQQLRKIDIDFREMLDLIITCKPKIIRGELYIKLFFYDSLENYNNNIRKNYSMIYKASKYYKYYETLELIFFGEHEFI